MSTDKRHVPAPKMTLNIGKKKSKMSQTLITWGSHLTTKGADKKETWRLTIAINSLKCRWHNTSKQIQFKSGFLKSHVSGQKTQI